MQHRGINARYLGLVRKHSVDARVKEQCLLEMMSRIITIRLRWLFRNEAEKLGVFKQESFIQIACDFYNRLIDVSSDAWKDASKIKQRIIEKFGADSLSDEEKNGEYNLRDHISLSSLFGALEKQVGVSIRPEALERFSLFEQSLKAQVTNTEEDDSNDNSTELTENESVNPFSNFEFVMDDFLGISSSVKGLKLSNMAIGNAIRNQAINGKNTTQEKLRLLFRAAQLMEQGSRGDITARLKYIEMRLEITACILQEPDLLFQEGWTEKVNKHLKKTQSSFEEIRQLCAFNEVEEPKLLTYLYVESIIQKIYIHRKKSGAFSRFKGECIH